MAVSISDRSEILMRANEIVANSGMSRPSISRTLQDVDSVMTFAHNEMVVREAGNLASLNTRMAPIAEMIVAAVEQPGEGENRDGFALFRSAEWKTVPSGEVQVRAGIHFEDIEERAYLKAGGFKWDSVMKRWQGYFAPNAGILSELQSRGYDVRERR